VYQLFSVDDHVIEPPDTWSSRVPAAMRDRAPKVVDFHGRQAWAFEDTVEPQMGLNAVAGKPREEWGMEPTRFDDMIPGCYDPAARASDMWSNGIVASVNFPTLPGFGGRKFQTFKDKDLAMACVRAWNDFILDEWCAAAPGLFVPMVITATWDVDLATQEVRRCLDKGAKALCWIEDPLPLGLPGYHTDHWDPLMAQCQEADLPICMHIGSSGGSVSLAGTVPMVAIASAFVNAASCAVNMMCSPIPRKFTDLKLVWSEGGIGWIPAAIERADRQWDRHRYWTNLGGIRPSEVCARNMWFCMIEEPIGLKYRHDWDPTCEHILWESDYPHADTPWPHTQAAVKDVLDGVPDDEVRRITHENAEKLFHFTPELPAGYDFES
jgi:predicted TIM-barrel fold metal-dependent hydrolase